MFIKAITMVKLNYSYKSFLIVTGGLLFTIILSGCVTTGGSIQANYSNISQLEEADNLFDNEKYQTALLKYSSYVFSPFPNKKHEDYAYYKLALCHYLLGQYYDAQKTAEILVQTYPKFEYSEQANDLLAKSDNKINERKIEFSKQWNELLKEIEKTTQLAAQNPDSAEHQFKLGDLYWDAGKYGDAVRQYEKAAQLDKAYLEKKNLRTRVRIDQSGEFLIRDPMYQHIEKPAPVRVTQVRRDRITREDWLGEYEALRLSGYVENDGLYDVNNVQVEIAIYDFFDTIQETKLVNIGALQAGGRRPFTVMFNQYRDMAIDIMKYTTEIFFDESAAARR